MRYIYHITTQQAWDEAQPAKIYVAPSLGKESYIHCLTVPQIIPVANTLYKNIPDLILMEIDTERIEAEVKWEKHLYAGYLSEDIKEELYPHIYGQINTDSVSYTENMIKNHSDKYELSTAVELITYGNGLYSSVYHAGWFIHHIIQPLTHIKGFSSILKLLDEDELSSEQRNTMYTTINENADYLSNWIHGFRRYLKYLGEKQRGDYEYPEQVKIEDDKWKDRSSNEYLSMLLSRLEDNTNNFQTKFDIAHDTKTDDDLLKSLSGIIFEQLEYQRRQIFNLSRYVEYLEEQDNS